MFSDKKVLSGKIRFVLPAEPGKSALRSDITEKEILPVLELVFLRENTFERFLLEDSPK
jgi:3-dehydroquinate synthetase